VGESSYLRYLHLARDLITFTAEDDVWLASLSEAAGAHGTRAWRLTAGRRSQRSGYSPAVQAPWA
jgi:tricorn protease